MNAKTEGLYGKQIGNNKYEMKESYVVLLVLGCNKCIVQIQINMMLLYHTSY